MISSQFVTSGCLLSLAALATTVVFIFDWLRKRC